MKLKKSETVSAPKKPAKNGKIELLRFAFALIIACYHLGCSIQFSEERFKHGYMAVEFFFFVSGYFFAKSIKKKYSSQVDDLPGESLKFMGRKYLSFAYDYIAVIIMTVIAWVPYFSLTFKDWVIKVIGAVPTFLLVQMFGFRTAEWFVPVWYLSAMLIVMFILTPVMIKAGRFYSLYIAPVVSLAILGLIVNTSGGLNVSITWNEKLPFASVLRAFAEISLGCLCYYVIDSGILEKFNKYIMSVIGILMFIPPVLYMILDFEKTLELPCALLLFFGTAISLQNKDTFRFLNNRFIYFLGRLSLPVFLCHSIARYYTLWLDLDCGYYCQIGVFLLMTLALSLLCILLSTLFKAVINQLNKQSKNIIDNK